MQLGKNTEYAICTSGGRMRSILQVEEGLEGPYGSGEDGGRVGRREG